MKHVSSWSPTTSDTPDDAGVREHQKWNHITLTDFRSSSCWTVFTYSYLWFLAIIAIAVYAADTYTAVVLLAYNRWPGQISPAIPFTVSRWIFAACIVFSWLLCFYQWVRALRVMRRGSVVRDYLDPLAATLQSMRSWRCFLVFAELTKSRKGADYIALFTYFQFQGALRILLAEGPRQAINGITLYAVMRSNLLPNGQSKDSNFDQFWSNVRVLAMQQQVHAVLLFTMVFTLCIWIISALSLLIACLAWLCFLWHYVEKGNLSHWCKRKIEKRLRRIMEATFEKEIARQEKLWQPDIRPNRTFGSTSTTLTYVRRPTLPDVTENEKSLSFSEYPTRLSQQPYVSIPRPRQPPRKGSMPLARQPTLPVIDESPSIEHDAFAGPSRDNSNASLSTSSSTGAKQRHPMTQPLVASAAGMATTRMNRPSRHERLPASQSSIVPPPLDIPRKAVPARMNSIEAEPHFPPHPQASDLGIPPLSGVVHTAPPASKPQRFSFEESSNGIRGVHDSLARPRTTQAYHGPSVQDEYALASRTRQPTTGPLSQSRRQTRLPAKMGPSTFAAMGL